MLKTKSFRGEVVDDKKWWGLHCEEAMAQRGNTRAHSRARDAEVEVVRNECINGDGEKGGEGRGGGGGEAGNGGGITQVGAA